MLVDRYSMEHFVKKLPEFLTADEIKIETIKLPVSTENNWDMPAKQVMKDKFTTWLKQELGLHQSDIADTLFFEGIDSSLPPPDTSKNFFGSQCCPDGVLKCKDSFKIAVELDHGSSGAKLRDALTKASFNVIVGGFNRSIVLFFVELKERQERETKFDSNHPVLKLYEEMFATSVLFVTNYQPMP